MKRLKNGFTVKQRMAIYAMARAFCSNTKIELAGMDMSCPTEELDIAGSTYKNHISGPRTTFTITFMDMEYSKRRAEEWKRLTEEQK